MRAGKSAARNKARHRGLATACANELASCSSCTAMLVTIIIIIIIIIIVILLPCE